MTAVLVGCLNDDNVRGRILASGVAHELWLNINVGRVSDNLPNPAFGIAQCAAQGIDRQRVDQLDGGGDDPLAIRFAGHAQAEDGFNIRAVDECIQNERALRETGGFFFSHKDSLQTHRRDILSANLHWAL